MISGDWGCPCWEAEELCADCLAADCPECGAFRNRGVWPQRDRLIERRTSRKGNTIETWSYRPWQIGDVELGPCDRCLDSAREEGECEEWTRLADAVCAVFERNGVEVHGSSLSKSRYAELAFDRRVRISDHQLPPTYEALNGSPFAEIAIGTDFPTSALFVPLWPADAKLEAVLTAIQQWCERFADVELSENS